MRAPQPLTCQLAGAELLHFGLPLPPQLLRALRGRRQEQSGPAACKTAQHAVLLPCTDHAPTGNASGPAAATPGTLASPRQASS